MGRKGRQISPPESLALNIVAVEQGFFVQNWDLLQKVDTIETWVIEIIERPWYRYQVDVKITPRRYQVVGFYIQMRHETYLKNEKFEWCQRESLEVTTPLKEWYIDRKPKK